MFHARSNLKAWVQNGAPYCRRDRFLSSVMFLSSMIVPADILGYFSFSVTIVFSDPGV